MPNVSSNRAEKAAVRWPSSRSSGSPLTAASRAPAGLRAPRVWPAGNREGSYCDKEACGSPQAAVTRPPQGSRARPGCCLTVEAELREFGK